MKNLRAALKEQGGFTLLEMLLVVAVIAILVGISIPVFSDTLEKARTSVDAANEKSAISMARIWYLDHHGEEIGIDGRKLYYEVDPESHAAKITDAATAGVPGKFQYGLGGKEFTADNPSSNGAVGTPKGKGIMIIMMPDGSIGKIEWVTSPWEH